MSLQVDWKPPCQYANPPVARSAAGLVAFCLVMQATLGTTATGVPSQERDLIAKLAFIFMKLTHEEKPTITSEMRAFVASTPYATPSDSKRHRAFRIAFDTAKAAVDR